MFEMSTEKRGINSVHKALIDEGDDMTIEKTLAERGARYGDFFDHAAIAQDLQNVLRYSVYDGGKPCWQKLSPVQRQALTVICDKIARMLSGDPNYDDSPRDIAGYATLMLREIEGK